MNVRVAEPQEQDWFDKLLNKHHYLGAAKAVSATLRQVVEKQGKVVALLVWGPACYALKDRDKWIGWSATQRVERLKLVVQNRRFLLLVPKGSEPNLASQSMGAALRKLPQHWYERFGYRPVLAESFTDPEGYAGTCYKASNWEAVGMSQGYSRHRTDFYVPNDSPKKLWMYDLSGSGRKEITAVTLAPEHQGASIPQPGGVLPLDGKMIRDAIGVLTLAAHEDGSPQGMAVYDQKEGSGRSEQSAARQALAKMGRLDEKIITADALHCQRDLAASIVQQGGDYLLQIKGNQPAVLAQAQALDTCMDPPFSKKPKTRTDA